VSASDLSNFPRDEWENRTVADAMTAASRLFSLSPDDTLSVAADLIAARTSISSRFWMKGACWNS